MQVSRHKSVEKLGVIIQNMNVFYNIYLLLQYFIIQNNDIVKDNKLRVQPHALRGDREF